MSALCAAALLAAFAAPAFGQEASGFDRALAEEVARQGLAIPPAFERALEHGKTELQSRNYILAAQRLGEAYRECREHPLPAFLISLACVGMKDAERASDFLRYALQRWPGLPKAGPDLAAFLAGREEQDRLARELEDDLFSCKPGTAEASRALFLAGAFQAFGGDRKKAATYLGAVPRGAPEWAAAQLVLRAVQPASAAPRSGGPDPFEEGNRLFLEGKYPEAAHAFGAAAVANPADPLPCFEMGHALFAAGYFRHAARVLALGLEIQPRWVETGMDRESLYPEARRGDYAAHLKRLEAWVLAHPDDGAAQFLLGYNRFFSKEPASSRGALEAAAKAGWERPSALFLKRLAAGAATPEGGGRDPVTPVEPPKAADPCKAGNAKLAEGDFDGAAAEYGRGIEDKEPARAADAMLGVSAAWLGKGDTAKAARWIRMAYGAEPGVLDRAGAEKTFGPGDLFRRKLPDLARAAADVDAARQAGKEPTEADHETWFLCGCCLCLAGRPEEAAERFNEIILQWAEADAAARELYLKLKKKN